MSHDTFEVLAHVMIWIRVRSETSVSEFVDVVVRKETKSCSLFEFAKTPFGAIKNGDGREAGAQAMVTCLFEFADGEVRRGLVVSESDMNCGGQY